MTKLDSLVKTVLSLTAPQQKYVGAMVGACVADAATTPLHWIYDGDKLSEILRNAGSPEFYQETQCPFYVLPTGSNSCYNEIMLCSLFYLSENKGQVSTKGVCDAFVGYFGEGTVHDIATKKRKEPGFKLPIHGPYTQASVLTMVEKVQKGEPLNNTDDNQYNGFMAALPFIWKHMNYETFMEDMVKVVELFTTHKETIKMFKADFALMKAEVGGLSGDPMTAMKEVLKESPDVLKKLEAIEADKDQSFVNMTEENGKACYLPGTFLSSFHAIIQGGNYVDSVRLNIAGGGCNCSRANVIGAYFGARDGIECIPRSWMEKVPIIEKVIEAAINIVKP